MVQLWDLQRHRVGARLPGSVSKASAAVEQLGAPLVAASAAKRLDIYVR